MDKKDLKATRLKLGHSQNSLATILGISTRNYIRFEKGQADIPPMLELAMRVVPSRLAQKREKRKSI